MQSTTSQRVIISKNIATSARSVDYTNSIIGRDHRVRFERLALFHLFIALSHIRSIDAIIYIILFNVCVCVNAIDVAMYRCHKQRAAPEPGRWEHIDYLLQCTLNISEESLQLPFLPCRIVNGIAHVTVKRRRALDKQEDDICNFNCNVQYGLQVHWCKHTREYTINSPSALNSVMAIWFGQRTEIE